MATSDSCPPKAVLLDFDHTLFTFDDSSNWVRTAHARLGRTATEARIKQVYDRIEAARRSPEVVREWRGCQRSTATHHAAVLSWFDRAGVDRILAEALYARLLSPDGWTPYRDVAATMTALRQQGVPVAVVSNVGWDIRPTFASHGIGDGVSTFVLSCELGAEKPDLAMFRAACYRLGVEPHEALMIGDDPVNDGASVRAGLRFHLLPDRNPGEDRGLASALELFNLRQDGSRTSGE
jgi:HAD superfamily hydrolase (TIGR01509 family)